MIKLDDTPKQEGMELKPCPFCGGEAYIDYRSYGCFVVPRCQNCNCNIGAFGNKEKQEAAEAWNRRADVAPIVHGHWIEDDEVVCSECGELGFTEYRNGEYCLPDYCPWCGAKMDGKDGEQE